MAPQSMAMRVMRGPSRDTLRPALKRLGESEFRLAEKLGLRGILDDDTGEEIPEAQFYKSFADFYSAMGDHEAAFAVCQKIRELGDLSEMQYAMVLEDAGQYREAIEYYRQAEEAFPAKVLPRLEEAYLRLEDYKMAYFYACKQRQEN